MHGRDGNWNSDWLADRISSPRADWALHRIEPHSLADKEYVNCTQIEFVKVW